MNDPAFGPLVTGVKLLSLDAGNTVIFLDHARLARFLSARGHAVSEAALLTAEGEAKKLQEEDAMVDVDWAGRDRPGARSWGKTVATMLVRAKLSKDVVTRELPAIFEEHVRLNFWSRVPGGLAAALARARARGIKVAVVSNSEGMLDELFVTLGIRGEIDLLLDSGKVGIEKPDPRIFQLALDAFGLTASQMLHLGDSIATDVEGARAVGARVALIDPFGQSAGRALDVPRVPGVAEVADALA
jgi:HAD superfamily hydrolase (TIGR01509 family)